MRKILSFVFSALVLVLPWSVGQASANPFEYTWQQLAPDVWAAIRRDPFALPQEGNSVFVVTSEGVVVFDAGGSPAMGESIVAQVKSVTSQPITHVVLSHWHGDHMRGLQAIQTAFPRVQIFAHSHTRAWIDSTQARWLKRRVSMVPGIRRMVDTAFAHGKDLAGRALVPEEKVWIDRAMTTIDDLDSEN